MEISVSSRSLAFIASLLSYLAISSCNISQDAGDHHQQFEATEAVHDHGQARFDRNHIQNQDHIMEHYEGVLNKPESEMTEQELQFHYFKLHDYDQNNKLDGIEIINALTHYHKDGKSDDNKETRMPDEEMVSVVDGIMEDEDKNKDGYIDYSEFVSAQRSQAEEAKSDSDKPLEPTTEQ